MKRLLERYPKTFYRDLLGRVVLLTVFGGSLALLWWSVKVRLPIIDRTARESTKVILLGNQVQQMELRWNDSEAEEVTEALQAQQQRLFTNAVEFPAWQDELQRRGNALLLKITTQTALNQKHPATHRKLSVVPATVGIESAGRSTNSLYNRVLRLLDEFQTAPKRMDVIDLSATATSNSLSSVRLAVHFWMDESQTNVPALP
jgi:hypothetical protein